MPSVSDGRRVVLFNYCGNVCAGGTHGGAGFVRDLVREADADSVLLQEVCRTQAEHLRGVLGEVWGEADVHYVSTFVGDLGGLNDCQGDDYGVAILAPSIRDTWVEPLPNPGLGDRQIDRRAMPCASLARAGEVVCTTHLVRAANDPEGHRQQVHAFIEHARALSGRFEDVLVAGDLNDDASTFDPLIREGDAEYIAGDDRRGVDHVFASNEAYVTAHVTRRRCSCSDHAALVVTLERR